MHGLEVPFASLRRAEMIRNLTYVSLLFKRTEARPHLLVNFLLEANALVILAGSWFVRPL